MRSATTSSKCRRRPIASGMRFTAERPERGRRQMYSTTYHRPSSVDEAVALFGKGKEAKYLAGGQTLIPVMKQRLAAPSDGVYLAKIKELVGIDVSSDTVTIKAATPHYDVSSDGGLQRAIPALAYLASTIGDPAVRHRGTIGGPLPPHNPP